MCSIQHLAHSRMSFQCESVPPRNMTLTAKVHHQYPFQGKGLFRDFWSSQFWTHFWADPDSPLWIPLSNSTSVSPTPERSQSKLTAGCLSSFQTSADPAGSTYILISCKTWRCLWAERQSVVQLKVHACLREPQCLLFRNMHIQAPITPGPKPPLSQGLHYRYLFTTVRKLKNQGIVNENSLFIFLFYLFKILGTPPPDSRGTQYAKVYVNIL